MFSFCPARQERIKCDGPLPVTVQPHPGASDSLGAC